MAVHYLIDGYNLLYALDEMPPGTWQEKRAQLIAFLKTRKPQGNNPITVVFDSREGAGDRAQEKELTIVYTSGGTADDWISDEVRRQANPRALVVVSNDQGIRALVRGTGAKFLSATEFLKPAAVFQVPQEKTRRPTPENDSDITEELKRKWLE